VNPRVVEAHMSMKMPEAPPRAAGFWCAFWLVSLVAFGALLWQYSDRSEAPSGDGAQSDGEFQSEDRPERRGEDRAGRDGYEREAPAPTEPLEGGDERLGERDGPRPEAPGRDRDRRRDGARDEAPAPLVITPDPRFIASGGYVAQLGAFRAERSVRPAWDRLSRRAPDLFEEARLDVQRVEIKGRGVFYRMRAGYFADRTNALRFCQQLRAVHQECLPVQR
jgi:hypothetical protein